MAREEKLKKEEIKDKVAKYVDAETSKLEKALRHFFALLRSNRKLLLLLTLGIVIIAGAIISYSIYSTNKKHKIASEFFLVNKDYNEKIKKQIFDINAVGETIKKLKEVAEMSSTVEEALLARYFLGVLYYNIARSENKPGFYKNAIDYFYIVADQHSFAFAPQSLLAIGSCYEDFNTQNFYQKAIEFYDIIIDRYPNTVFANRANYKKGVCYIKLNKKDLAIDAFKKVPQFIGEEASRRENIYYKLGQDFIIWLESQR